MTATSDATFLIEPDALEREIALGDVLVIDARKRSDYEQGHIPGAVHLSTYDSFVPDTTDSGMAAFAADMAARFGAAGVSRGRPVIVYEKDTGMRAARELWVLEYLGHRNALMLHGGLDAWQAAGGAITAALAMMQPAEFVPDVATDVLIGADEIRENVGSTHLRLLDVRDEQEYGGRDATACCARRGHVPGAVWIEWTGFLEKGRYKRPEAIRALLSSRGLDDTHEIAPYCHRGARSANTYYALRYAGMTKTRNFIGSWHEWSARPDLPIEK